MASLKIEGGRALSGRVAVEGNKNSALPLIAACMLTEQPCELTNVPRIRDVDVLLDLIEALGATRRGEGHRHAADPVRDASPAIARIRCWSGGCAARCCCSDRCWRGAARRGWRRRAATFPRGARSRRTSRRSSRSGRVPLDEPGHAMHAPNGLKGASFYLDEASVTGTETALLAAAAADGSSEIRHAAMEPHVVELCEFLQAMGVGVEGAGSSTLRVHPAGAPRRAPRTGWPATTSRRAAGAWSPRSPTARSR